jgi:uncharacterized protein
MTASNFAAYLFPIVVFASGLLHWRVWRILEERFPEVVVTRRILLSGIALLSALLTVWAAASSLLLPMTASARPLLWTVLLWHGALLTGVLLLRRRVTAAGRQEEFHAASEVDTERRDVLRKGAAGFGVIVFSSPLGNISHDDDYEIVYKTVRLRRLPEQLAGVRIAMISDIHSGPFMAREDIEPYVGRINALKPDMILLPGDFIESRNEEIEVVCELFRRLQAPYGVYGCTGNHDYFADADHVSNELELAGVRMLRDAHQVVDIDGESLALIGLDDVGPGASFLDQFMKASRGLDPGIPNILMCHKPYFFEDAAGLGLDLMVSGHTHGGQIVLARVFNTVVTPLAIFTRYIEGLYRRDATQLYVTRGIGTVMVPIRINCPPEITVLTLASS